MEGWKPMIVPPLSLIWAAAGGSSPRPSATAVAECSRTARHTLDRSQQRAATKLGDSEARLLVLRVVESIES